MNRWSKWAPFTGVVFFITLLVSFLLDNNSLDGKSSGAQVIAHYTTHRDRVIGVAILTLVAVFFGVLFYGVLRDRLRKEGSRGLVATAFGGALLFGLGGALSAGVQFALTDAPSHLTASTAQTLNLLDTDMVSAGMAAGIAILLCCYGMAILRTEILPHWLGWVAFPFVVLAFTPLGFFSFIAAGVWTLIVSGILSWRALAEGAPETAAMAAPA